MTLLWSFVTTFLLLLAPTSAYPKKDPKDKKKEESEGGKEIKDRTLNRFKLFAQYAAASYCPSNYEARKKDQIRCAEGKGSCPLLEKAKVDIEVSFSKTPLTDTTGFVALDKTNKHIIVAFRGTESIRNFISDFAIPLVPTELCDGCRSASGFYTAWREVKDDVLEAVKRLHEKNPDFRTITTGHSLGGAVAALAAADLRDAGHIVDYASFGSPRVGNSKTTEYITKQAPDKGKNYRIVHRGDPIPSYPHTFSGYRHVSPEYYINTDEEVADIPKLGDIFKRVNDENGEGIIGTSLFSGYKAHENYFGKISKCYPGLLTPF